MTRRQLWVWIATAIVTLGMGGRALADQYPFHADPGVLVVTRGDRTLARMPCERIDLEGAGRWGGPSGHANPYVSAHLKRASDGKLYLQCGASTGAYWVCKDTRSVMFESLDDGRTWTKWNVDLPQGRNIGAFTILEDDAFLVAATQPSDDMVSYYLSTDRGRSWTLQSEVEAAPFKQLYIDGNMLTLQDGTVISTLHFLNKPGDGEGPLQLWLGGQFILRSKDGGKTWENGPDRHLWTRLNEAELAVLPQGPKSRIPGGTFPGCYETGIMQEPSGRLVAALRFSGAAWAWHEQMREAWGGRDPDDQGRIFRQVMFSTSADGGETWEMMRPFFDAQGQPVIIQQETNGHVLPLPDGRLVLIHQRRFGPMQNIARVSLDGGETWLHDEYRLSSGFGFPSSIVLEDGTIVTATGRSVDGKPGAQVIRWKLPAKAEMMKSSQESQ